MSFLFQMVVAVSFLLLVLFCNRIEAGRAVTSKMKAFTSAIKGGQVVAGEEYQVFNTSNGPGVITEQWFTGSEFDENTIVRYYIDGDTTPTIEYLLLLGHGIGSTASEEDSHVPYGTKRIGHNAKNGALFNTYRVPYQKSIAISVTSDKTGAFWFIVRGVTNYPVILGDLELPANTRLRLYKNEDVVLQPLQFLTLANVTGTAGALFQVTMAARSTDMSYMEACMRTKIDGATDYTYLSSGTSDFFLSASNFNAGIYHGDDAGCTYTDSGDFAMSGYKFFESDPILFGEDFQLVWRCGATVGVDACPTGFPNNFGDANAMPGDSSFVQPRPQLANTTVTTYAWVYEYSL